MTNAEPQAAVDDCEHHYETRILGGHPLHVRACTLCRTPDWTDLYEQADTLYRWGREEGMAGKPPRERLSAYDMPQRDDAQPTPAPADTLRQRIAEAVDGTWRKSLETHAWGPRARAEITDAVLAAVQPELDRLDQRAEQVEATLVSAKRAARGIGAWGVLQAIEDAGPLVRDRELRVLADEVTRLSAIVGHVRMIAERWQAAMRLGETHPAASAILRALDGDEPSVPAHDAGPSVREAAAADRTWPLQKHGE